MPPCSQGEYADASRKAALRAASTALWTSVVGWSTLDFGNNDHYGLVTTSDGDYDTTGLDAYLDGLHQSLLSGHLLAQVASVFTVLLIR